MGYVTQVFVVVSTKSLPLYVTTGFSVNANVATVPSFCYTATAFCAHEATAVNNSTNVVNSCLFISL